MCSVLRHKEHLLNVSSKFLLQPLREGTSPCSSSVSTDCWAIPGKVTCPSPTAKRKNKYVWVQLDGMQDNIAHLISQCTFSTRQALLRTLRCKQDRNSGLEGDPREPGVGYTPHPHPRPSCSPRPPSQSTQEYRSPSQGHWEASQWTW